MFLRSLILVLLLALEVSLLAAPPNLLTNPGFESGLTAWAAYGGGTVQAVTTTPHSGTQAGRSTARTSTNHGFRQSVLTTAVPGKCHVASAWVRTSSATPVTVNVGMQQTDGWGAKFYGLQSVQVANVWTRISSVFRCDVNGALTVLNVYFHGPPSGVDLFLDDVSFTTVDTDARENLLTNPAFENGTAGWVAHGPATVATTAAIHTGTGAGLVSARTAVWQGIEQSVFGKTEDGRMYSGAGWVTTDSAAPEAVKLTVEVIDSSGSRFFQIAAGTATSATWTWLAGTVTLPATSGLTNVKFFVEGPASGVGLRVDDCYFAPATGLRRAAAAYPALRLGGVGGVQTWAENPAYRATMSAHFHLVSPENALKFAGTEPADGFDTFAEGNAINELGLARGGSSRGHCFVWHGGLPTWVSAGSFSAAQMQTLLWDHIDRTAAAYRHRLVCWDVVNEAINDTNGGLRSTLWYDPPGIGFAAGGDQYIREAFLRARAADPDAPLFYNDYSIEAVNTKSDAVHAMLASFLGAGVPVQGVGFQSHFSSVPSGSSLRTNFQRFQDLGLDLHITELDLRVPVDGSGFATAANLAAQGDSYFTYLGIALGYSRMKVFQTWGVYDGASWVPGFYPGFGQALLFDFALDRKPAYWGVWNALAGQCEKLSVLAQSSGDAQSVITDTRLSANAARRLSADATNDFLTLRAHVPFSGQWNVKIGVLRQAAGGRLQLAIAPPGSAVFTNVGAVQDTYAAADAATVFDLGTVTFAVAGDWQWRCTVAGKNASATDYDLTLDYVRLTPVACAPEVSALPDQSIALNSALPARLFLAEDDAAQGTLQVTATAANAALLPPGAVVVEGASPYYALAATPALDQLGTSLVSVTANDGTQSFTESFTLTVTGSPVQTWRQQNFGSAANAGPGADSANPDGDGFTNAQEYTLGTAPTTSTANPLQGTPSGANLLLSFTALRAEGAAYGSVARLYDLQTTTDLSTPASWQPVAGYANIVGNNQLVTATQPVMGARRYFRLNVRLQ